VVSAAEAYAKSRGFPVVIAVFGILILLSAHSTAHDPITGQPLAPTPFYDTSNFASTSAPLPHLDLARVFVLTGPGTCSASEAAVLYDAPSVRAKPLFVIGRDTAFEVIVVVEGWLKIRDVGGTVPWIEGKATSERRTLIVRVPVADVVAAPDANAPLVFKAEQNVVLELLDPAYVSNTPGWAKVRHRDGQQGYVRIAQVWGL